MLPPMYFASPSKHIFSTSNMTKSTGKKDTASENGCFKINKYFQEVKPTRPTKDDNENRMGLASKQRGSGIANNKRKGQEKASKLEKGHHAIFHFANTAMIQLFADFLGMAGTARYNRNIRRKRWQGYLEKRERKPQCASTMQPTTPITLNLQ